MSENNLPPLDPSGMRYNFYGLFVLSGVFVIFMSLSSLIPEVWFTTLFRLLAVVIPLLLIRIMPLCRTAVVDREIGFNPKPIISTLWLLPVFLGLVVSMSYLTNLICTALDVVSPVDLGNSVWLALFRSALLPALTEELFCRFIFLPRISAYSKSGAVFVSALFFSFMHGNILQIPYALIAGIFLGALTLATCSALPAIVFHLINNAASVLLYFYQDTVLPTVLLWTLIGGVVVSVVCIILFRRRLWTQLKDIFACNANTKSAFIYLFTTPIVVYIIIFGAIAVLNVVG